LRLIIAEDILASDGLLKQELKVVLVGLWHR